MEPEPSKYGHYLGAVIAAIGFLISAAGVVVFAYQCLLWLRTGFWTPMDMRTLLGDGTAAIEWRGIQKIISWFLDWPLSVGLFFAGAALFSFGTASARGARDQQAAYRLRMERLARDPKDDDDS